MIEDLLADGVSSLIVLPLFPQYSATSTAAAFDKIAKLLLHKRQLPELHFITEYHNHPTYIEALAQSVERYWAVHGRADKLLMSFHGILSHMPIRAIRTLNNAVQPPFFLADRLGLSINEWAMSFQSRFGAQEWLKPYTDELLGEWGAARLSVQVISPAFSADCLETLEELAVENKGNFASRWAGV